VIKLGGSLLDLEGLADKLRRWLWQQQPADNLILVGGGPLVDSIRQADRLHRLGQEASHWLSIRAMDVTARLLGAMLPELPLSDRLEHESSGIAARILLPLRILEALDAQSDLRPLAHHWDVTSDSIAAWLASIVRADELVLLKSRLPSAGQGAGDLVDPRFGEVTRGIPVIRCVNLRDAATPEIQL
jgi:aspartokinase-like uncharacterized kinase